MIAVALANLRSILIGAAIVAVISAIGAVYWKGRVDARHAIELQSLERQVEILEHNNKVLNDAALADKERAKQDALVLETYEGAVDALMADLEEAGRICLSARDTDGLRGLWSEGSPKNATSPRK